MAKQTSPPSFCCVDNFQVMIPYRDLENLLRIANNFGSLLDRMDKLEKKHEGLHGMYFEALEKIAEINRII